MYLPPAGNAYIFERQALYPMVRTGRIVELFQTLSRPPLPHGRATFDDQVNTVQPHIIPFCGLRMVIRPV